MPAEPGILAAMTRSGARPAGTAKRSPGSKGPSRVTPRQVPAGRYTPPIPRSTKVSPPWYPWVLLAFFVLGLAVIVVNYAGIFWGATNWALVGGIGAILAGTIMATRYR